MAKDLFSEQSSEYAAFRPHYPDALYQFLYQHVDRFDFAWDCATGNGQAAHRLAQRFSSVEASDISAQQIQHAIRLPNIRYSICPAEATPFADHTFDLITVAQALHWFDTESFYSEVRRTAKPGALLAVWGYDRVTISPEIDPLIRNFYHEVVGRYWDHARKHIEAHYETLPFPFKRIEPPRLKIAAEWTPAHLLGYLRSWSATRKFMKEEKYDPVTAFSEQLAPLWASNDSRVVQFPVFMLVGKI